MTPGKLLLPLLIPGFVILMGFASVPHPSDAPDSVSAEPQVVILANLKVFIEGPYVDVADSMSTNLILLDELPLTQPYDSSIYVGTQLEYAGTELVSDWTGARATVVDWVLVELRTTTAASSAFATRAGLLLSTGVIVDIDGTSALGFSSQPAGDYYVVVRQRNHLAVMSAAPITMDATTPALYDFSTAQSQAFGTNPMIEIETGVFGMYSGDADGSTGVTATDNTAWLAENGTAGYLTSDFDLSGGATATDNTIWLGNNGISDTIPD
ncbi:MAG: hypothetical protein HKN43_06700 [Rhodothermales bacterium]|nr:hypothetical protein [Rhodothermales bacterium]